MTLAKAKKNPEALKSMIHGPFLSVRIDLQYSQDDIGAAIRDTVSYAKELISSGGIRGRDSNTGLQQAMFNELYWKSCKELKQLKKGLVNQALRKTSDEIFDKLGFCPEISTLQEEYVPRFLESMEVKNTKEFIKKYLK